MKPTQRMPVAGTAAILCENVTVDMVQANPRQTSLEVSGCINAHLAGPDAD